MKLNQLLLEIYNFISRNNAFYWLKFIETIISFIGNLSIFPMIWNTISEISNLREIVEPTF